MKPHATNKEQDVSRKLMQLIQDDTRKVGARLPSERELAGSLGASRNTLRGAMRLLQAHGVVDIRPGSGSYILSKETPFFLQSLISERETRPTVAEVMETRYLVEPVIAAQASGSATGDDLDRLEACLTRLSRASIDNQYDQLMAEDIKFRKQLAQSTGNRLLITIHRQIAAHRGGSIFGHPLEPGDKASLFADLVGIFNAVQNRNQTQAHLGTQHHILRQCRLMAAQKGVEMSPAVTEALQHLDRSPKDDGPPDKYIL